MIESQQRDLPPSTLTEALHRAARRHSPDHEPRLSIIDRHEQPTHRSWTEVRQGSVRWARRLQSAGIRRGDPVGLIFPTGFDFVEAFFALLMIEAVPAPLYPPVRLGRLREYHERTVRMLDSIGAGVLLTERRTHRILGEVADARRDLQILTAEGLERGAERELGPGPGTDLQSAAADDLCLIQFSSGTTVDPKPIALSHRAVMAQVEALNGFWPDSTSVRHSGASWLPLYHDMGLIGCLFTAIERPANLTLIPPELFVSRPASWLRAISAARATISPAPSFAYGLCVDKIRDSDLEGVDLSSWRVALNGAESVAAPVARAFCERFAAWGFRPEAMTPVYGLSEASLAVTFSEISRPFRARRFSRDRLASAGLALEDPQGTEIVSVGRPLPGCALSIRSDTGTPLDRNQVGRVWIKSSSLMSGYFGNLEATNQVVKDGWLDTGDVGFIHEGELYLSGRAKDVVIVRGQNHRPDDIEHAIDGLLGVRTGCTAAVSSLPEDGTSEQLLILAERGASESPETDDEEIAKRIRERILAVVGLMADRVEILEPGTLPRTSSGKIRRREALRRFLDGSLAPPGRVTPIRLLGALIRSRTAMRRALRRRQTRDGTT